MLPLLVATDGAVAAFGRDVRRLRPNVLIGGVEGMDEVDSVDGVVQEKGEMENPFYVGWYEERD